MQTVMADPRRERKKRSPAKSYEADTPSIPVRGHSKGQKTAEARPDNMATKSRRVKRKRTGQVYPTSSTVAVVEQKPQDPFERLSSAEIGLVIESLPVESTHTLRLVSKLWKACSEYHNGVLAIRRHFPHGVSASETYETREEANLRFRRLLYHQGSLRRGLATRVTRCTSAFFDHLNGNRLLWSNDSGTFSSCQMRSAKNITNLPSSTLHLSPLAHLRRSQSVQGAWVTANGDFIFHIGPSWDTVLMAANDEGSHPLGLVRMSCKGRAIWDAPHKRGDIIGNLALSTTLLYYILGSASMAKCFFVARSLEDGSLVFQEDVPFALTYGSTSRLELFGGDKWAAFRDEEGKAKTWIIDTKSREIVYSFYCGSDSRLVFSTTKGKFWALHDTHPQRLQLAFQGTYDVDANTFMHEELWLDFTPRARSFIVGFDCDQQLCFRVKRDTIHSASRLSVTFLRDQQSKQEDGIRPGRLGESSLAMVTLPARLPRMGSTRRELDLSRLGCMPGLEGLFCGMVGEYLVVHSRIEKEFVVVDFWPDW